MDARRTLFAMHHRDQKLTPPTRQAVHLLRERLCAED